jgi:hypothetical protein
VADDLTPAESAVLIVLMAEARKISNNELKERYQITLDGASRRKLNKLEYVKTDETVRPFVHELVDKGWVRVHEDMNFDSPKAKALGAALSALHVTLRTRVLEHGEYRRFSEMFARTAEVQPGDDDLEARVRRVYDALTSAPGAWIKITAVRQKLGDVTEAALDDVFLALSEADDVDMMPESNQKTLTDEDRRGAVRVGGQDTHLLAIGTR